MRHVTEGDLHAWLDGALAGIDPEAARRLEEHLGRCADCRALLEREREVRDHSQALLDEALPAPARIPPFESIGVGKGSGSRSGWAPDASRLSWAASIVIALAAGWMGHALLRSSGSVPSGPGAASSEAAPVDRLAGALPDEARQEAFPPSGRARDDGAASGDRDAGEAAPSGTGRAPEEGPGAPVTDPSPSAPERERDLPPPAARALAEEPREQGRQADRLERAGAARRDATEPEPALAAGDVADLRVAARLLGATEAELEGEVPDSASWRAIRPDEALAWLGRPPLAVADLPVVDLGAAELEERRFVRVRQRLPGGETLELIQRATPEEPVSREAGVEGGRAARLADSAVVVDELAEAAKSAAAAANVAREPADPALRPSAAPHPVGLEAEAAGIRLTARAAVAPDSLAGLLSRLRPYPGPGSP